VAKVDVAIIGAGAAGLSAGALLAREGKKVLIGVDRAARAALTVVEDYLGRRLAGFEDAWRY
jgi:thioredoxin reductase